LYQFCLSISTSLNIFYFVFRFQVCVVSGRQYTYSQLRDSSAAFAVRLQTKFKLGKGDVLAVCLPNVPEYPGVVLGAMEAGLTTTTVNPIYTAGKCKFILRHNIHSFCKNILDKIVF